MSYRTAFYLGVGWIIAGCTLGCQRPESHSELPAPSAPKTTDNAAATGNAVITKPVRVEVATGAGAAIESAVETPATMEPQPPHSAPLTIAEKIKRRSELQQRIQQRMIAARSKLTDREQELEKQIAFHGEVFKLLGEDIANNRFNLANRGLVMPWELTARRNLLTHGRRALESPVTEGALGLAAEIGNEQLASVKGQIAALEREQYSSIAGRVWRDLAADEQAACEEYLPEFVNEASGQNAAEENRLSSALASEPRRANLLEARGRLRVVRGELHKAVEDLEACIQFNPENISEVRLLYGELMLELGNQRAALAQFTAVASLKTPIAAEGWARRGLMAFHDNEIKYAQENVDRALQVDPNCASAYYLQARVHARRDQLEDTIAAFRSAVRYAPENAVYQYELGEYLHVTKQSSDALAAFARAAELEPFWWRPYFLMGRVKFLQMDLAGALADFDLAAGVAPNEPIIFERRAIVHSSLGNTAEAAADRQQSQGLQSSK